MSALSLSAAVGLLIRVIERRNSIPILSNIMIQSDGKDVRLVATDLDTEVSARVPCKAAKFTTTVEGHLLDSIVRSIGGDGLRLDGNKLVIGVGPTFTLYTMPADDAFPRAKPFDAKTTFELPAAQLLADLHAVSPAMSTEETRYYLNGINMEVREGKLSFTATDGHRLHIVERDAPGGTGDLPPSIVMRKTVSIVRAALEALPEVATVKLSFARLKVQFEIGPVTIKAKLIDGSFPDVRRVIPTDTRGALAVPAAELLACAKAAQLVATEKTKTIKLDFKAGMATAKTSTGATMTAALPGRCEGELPDFIGFNASYLATICERFNGADVMLHCSDAAGPAIIKGENGALLTVLMPIRL